MRVPWDDLDDAVQDGLTGLIEQHRKWNPDVSEYTDYDIWMKASIKRRIIDGYRLRVKYRRRDPIYFVSLDRPGPMDVVADHTSPDEAFMAADLEDWLRQLDWPDEADRRVLHMLLDGMTQQAISEVEGVTFSRICQRVSGIRERLRRRLAAE